MEGTVAAEPPRSGARSQATIYWSVTLRKSLCFLGFQFVIHNVGSVITVSLPGLG